MPLSQQLRVPGPTPLPERVIRAQSRPMINHRGPEFAELLDDITSGLQRALQTSNDVLLFPCSGTGGLEAASANLISTGERVLVCSIGSFGDRWADVCAAFGADVTRLEATWGEAIEPEDIDQVLAHSPEIKTVFVTHNETSTGAVNDMPAIAAVVKGHGKLLAVDSVSGAGCLPLNVDELSLDVVVTGSQKGWLSPPGLSMIAVSAAAHERATTATAPRWYFDFARQKSFQDKHQTYSTPPLSVMYALQEGLHMLHEEGMAQVHARHLLVADMIRAGMVAMGLTLFAAEAARSNTVTAVRSPFDSAEKLGSFLATLRTEHGLVIAGGQGKLTGQIFRIGHLGAVEVADVYSILATMECALAKSGVIAESGRAVAAAQRLSCPLTVAASAAR